MASFMIATPSSMSNSSFTPGEACYSPLAGSGCDSYFPPIGTKALDGFSLPAHIIQGMANMAITNTTACYRDMNYSSDESSGSTSLSNNRRESRLPRPLLPVRRSRGAPDLILADNEPMRTPSLDMMQLSSYPFFLDVPAPLVPTLPNTPYEAAPPALNFVLEAPVMEPSAGIGLGIHLGVPNDIEHECDHDYVDESGYDAESDTSSPASPSPAFIQQAYVTRMTTARQISTSFHHQANVGLGFTLDDAPLNLEGGSILEHPSLSDIESDFAFEGTDDDMSPIQLRSAPVVDNRRSPTLGMGAPFWAQYATIVEDAFAGSRHLQATVESNVTLGTSSFAMTMDDFSPETMYEEHNIE